MASDPSVHETAETEARAPKRASAYSRLSITQKRTLWAWGFLAVPILFYVVIRFYPTGNAMVLSLQEWNL